MTEILFVSHQYPPSTGGMQRQSYELIKGMDQHFKAHKHVHQQGSKFSFFLKLKKDVLNILSQNPQIEAIHFNDGLMAAMALPLSKVCHLPFFVTLHGLDVVFNSELYQERYFPQIAERFTGIAVSEATKKACLSRGYSEENIFVALNGVGHEIASTSEDENFRNKLSKKIGINLESRKIILSVGRPVERKGFSFFTDRILPNLAEDVIYLVAGPEYKGVKKWNLANKYLPGKITQLLISSLGIPTDGSKIEQLQKENPDKIQYIPSLSWEDLKQLFRTADLFVMPNLSVEGDMEGFGLVALEAAMSETPVIASGIEGITSAIVDGKNGVLIEEGDIEDWVKKIDAFLSDDDVRNRFAKDAMEYTLENYSWKKMVGEYAAIFRSELERLSCGLVGWTEDLRAR